MAQESTAPWTTIGEYDAGIVTNRPNKTDGGMDFVASKHFFGAMLKYVCKEYGCVVIVNPPSLASKPIELTVNGDSAENVLQAIADKCKLELTVDADGSFVLSDRDTMDAGGRSINSETFPPWWDQ